MKIGLIDVDGHNFPNLALMRISAYHKSKGDDVEWWWTDLIHYDIVYMSKVFSSTYSKDIPEPKNADKVMKGGTGYCISLVDGKEVFDKSKNISLPPEIERMFPDYSIYPQYDYAVSMTSRGCPRGCSFCHVAAKEGRCATKVADVSDFWNEATGLKKINCCDPNILACKDKIDLLTQYRDTGCWIDYNQGLDIRLMTEKDAEILTGTKLEQVHFAWDNPKDDLYEKFKMFTERYKGKKRHGGYGVVYCLTNFEDCSVEEHIERALRRIYILRDLGYRPYVMIYNKPSAPRRIHELQSWVNSPQTFYKCKTFDEYIPPKVAKQEVNDD